MKASEILDKAADHIASKGWTRGRWYNPTRERREDCPACAAGAINMVAGRRHGDVNMYGETPRDQAFLALAHRIGSGPREVVEANAVGAVTAWNDYAVKLTQADVVAELRATAAAEREAGR